MISDYQLLVMLRNLFMDILKSDPGTGRPGIRLDYTLPEKKDDLPVVVLSFSGVVFEASGIGGIVKVSSEPDKGNRITRADRVKGTVLFTIWFAGDDEDVQVKIDGEAEFLSNLLEEKRNVLRSCGLLCLEFKHIESLKSSNDAPVWLINNGKALGKTMIYDFVYEYIAEEEPSEGIIEHVRINSDIAL